MRGAEALAVVLQEEGGAIAAELAPAPPAPDPGDPASIAAAGPRTAPHRADIDLAVRAAHEGARLHYGRSELLPIADPDLALLAGDRLYALGLARLAELGDLEAIAELADVIALSAQAHAGGKPDLADAAWALAARAIGHGPTPESEEAKAAARSGRPDAERLLKAAERALARRDRVS